MFSSLDGGVSWLYENDGHPSVAVFGLDRHPLTGQMVSATHGRGMFAVQTLLFTDGFETGNLTRWSSSQQ